MSANIDPTICTECGGQRTHEKGACQDCGERPCAYCLKLGTRRWSPPELAGYRVTVCAEHYKSMADERREALSRPRSIQLRPAFDVPSDAGSES